jgi:hypothetical protein
MDRNGTRHRTGRRCRPGRTWRAGRPSGPLLHAGISTCGNRYFPKNLLAYPRLVTYSHLLTPPREARRPKPAARETARW